LQYWGSLTDSDVEKLTDEQKKELLETVHQWQIMIEPIEALFQVEMTFK
jgi:hypothetical protein